MLLAGARVNDDCYCLPGIVDLLEGIIYDGDTPGRCLSSRDLGFLNFMEAVVASGSVTVLSVMHEVGSGDMPLPYFVLEMVATGNSYPVGSPRPMKFAMNRIFCRVCLRLLARMSFLSAERALAVDDTHPFMTLLQTWYRPGEGIHPVGFTRECFLGHPENHDTISHVMYLTVFMNRRYPWPPRHRHRADIEIAKWLQEDERNWTVTNEMFGLDRARETLTQAAILPGFLQARLEDHRLWLVFAACGCAEDGVFDERNIYFALLLHLATGGREMGGVWSGSGSLLNSFFSSRQEEGRLTSMLRTNCTLSTWFYSQGGRSILLDICRQRRRRVVQVGHPQHEA